MEVQLSEATRRMTNLEYVTSKMESAITHVKSEMEALKELDRYSRDSPGRSPEAYTLSNPTSSSASPQETQEKLKSLAILTSSVRSAVSRIEREVHGMALNTTILMQNLSYLQRNAPTKQFINSALLGLKNQPQPYPVMPSVTGAVTGSGDFIWAPSGYGQWNQSVPTNCKYATRKYGINRIQLFGGQTVKEPFFVNCFDGWTVSSFYH